MKIAIDEGHGVGRDRGAVGIIAEETMIAAITPRIIEGLIKAGHAVVQTRPQSSPQMSVSESLRRRVATANQQRCDYFVSLHFNAFNRIAHGAEVFAISIRGQGLARAVQDELVGLGFRDRGVKNGEHLFVVRETNMPAILIEGCFCDSKRDCDLFDGDAMAEAVLRGLLSILGSEEDEEEATKPKS